MDLNLLSRSEPAISDALCDVEKETITLMGSELKGCRLSFRRLLQNDAYEVVLPSGGMTVEYSDDGKTITIRNAKNLFGTCTEFKASRLQDGAEAKSKFFLVKGQKKLEKISERLITDNGSKNNLLFYHLVTDADGRELFGINLLTGVIAHFNGKQFNEIDGTEIETALFDWMEDSGRLDRYNLYNNCTTDNWFTDYLLNEGNMVYQIISLNYGTDYTDFFASLDLSDVSPHWSFTEMSSLPAIAEGLSEYQAVPMEGKLYVFVPSDNNDETTPGTMPVCSYDITSNTWSREADMPHDARYSLITSHDGRIYFMFGHDVLNPHSSAEDGLCSEVYCLENNSWKQMDDIEYIGRFKDFDGEAYHMQRCAEVKNGFVFIDTSVDGSGNTFLYNTNTGKCEPMYYSLGDSISDVYLYSSCVETRDGIYYTRLKRDELKWGYELYLLPANSGAYESRYEALNPPEPEPKPEPEPPAPEKKPALNKTSADLKAGMDASLQVLNGKAVSWFSSSPSVAMVSGSGKVTALKKGTATIYAVLNGDKNLTCRVNVTSSPKLSKKSITVKKGKKKSVKITGKADSVKNVYKNTKKAKVVSGKNAAVIKVKGLKRGSTTLKIKVNGVSLKLKVKVN